jgi:phage terminase small subunit
MGRQGKLSSSVLQYENLRMKLKARQADFVREYLVDLNATQAAVRAGYSPKTARSIANENLTKPDIQAAIESERKIMAARCELSQAEVIKGIRDTIERCSDPALDADGKSRYHPMAVLRGLEMLARHLGMFVDKHEVTGRDGKDLTAPVAPVIYLTIKKA